MQAPKKTSGEIAKSGVDKTNSTIEGQMTAHTPADWADAERKERVELEKRKFQHNNAAAVKDRGLDDVGGVFGPDAGGDQIGTDYRHHPTYTSTEHGSGYPTGGDMTSGVVLPDTLGIDTTNTGTAGYDLLTGTGSDVHRDRRSYS